MGELGIPEYLINIIKNIYYETVAHIDGINTPDCSFKMNKGVK